MENCVGDLAGCNHKHQLWACDFCQCWRNCNDTALPKIIYILLKLSGCAISNETPEQSFTLVSLTKVPLPQTVASRDEFCYWPLGQSTPIATSFKRFWFRKQAIHKMVYLNLSKLLSKKIFKWMSFHKTSDFYEVKEVSKRIPNPHCHGQSSGRPLLQNLKSATMDVPEITDALKLRCHTDLK